ncbi:MAG: recombinase family protein, partial [Bacteroidetes bacterium]|nr:recombinase family protein [Bacteroidota bacterium]
MHMSQLDYFKKFIASDETQVYVNRAVWSYTRVSSKEQFEQNSSVQRQIEANRLHAEENDFAIVEEFGGTYESAKSDFTRKEFSRLIDKVKRARKKPYAILVYKMSRFSRSGGNAIGLVSYLVDELKVHLIEVSTGLDTTTDRGKAAIWESLFHAFKENLERKEIIVPNMIAFAKAGG